MRIRPALVGVVLVGLFIWGLVFTGVTWLATSDQVRPLGIRAAAPAVATSPRIEPVAGVGSAAPSGSAFPPLVALVMGPDGRALAGVPVRFEVDALPDPQVGTAVHVDGHDFLDVVSDAQGRVTAVATGAGAPGAVGIRARVLATEADLPAAQFDLVVSAPAGPA